MALELYHLIPSIKDDESFDYFTLDEFADQPNFIQKHQHLIAEIDDFDHDFEILVFPDPFTKDIVLENHSHYSEKPILIGDIEQLGKQINDIVSAASLLDKEPLILKTVDNLFTDDESKEIFYHSISYETEPTPIKVLFYSEKGHQRKGMNNDFYENFINGKIYFDKDAVLKAYNYLEPRPGDNKEELQHKFKEQFIDNFNEGESMFFINW